MAKQTATINFSQGINTKVDPWQLPFGQFESLVNSVFTEGEALTKRNGYGEITTNTPASNHLTTLNGNLTAIGSTVNAYSETLGQWITKGQLQPCSLEVMPLVRNSINQVSCDSIQFNNFVCTVYTETNNTNSGVNRQDMIVIADATTGQNIVEPTAIPVLPTGTIAGFSRVFVVGAYFVIVSDVSISGTHFLQYCSISNTNPVNVSTNVANISAAQNVFVESYNPVSANAGWDAVTVNSTANSQNLIVGWNTISGSQTIQLALLTNAMVASNQASSLGIKWTGANYIGALMSLCADTTTGVIYVHFWNNSNNNLYTAACTAGYASITSTLNPVISLNALLANVTSAAQNGSCQVFAEASNSYSYDSSIPTNYIQSVVISSTGSIGTPYTVVRSVGLGSKVFIVNGQYYFLTSYQSPYQSTYFLINGSSSVATSPVIVAKLAYQNGGGYLPFGLPNTFVNGNSVSIPYLFKDDVQALNTINNPQSTSTGGIYSQTGINLATFNIGTSAISTVETASNLHISGGYLSHYDGYLPVEHNFFLFPDSVECTWNASSAVTPTGTAVGGTKTVTVSSSVGIFPGMTIVNTAGGHTSYIPTGTQVVFVNGTTLTLSNSVTTSFTGDSLSIQGNIAAIPTGGTANTVNYYYQAVYQWTDNQGLPYYSSPSIAVPVTTTGSGTSGTVTINVPNIRLTAKTANPPSIVIYRWSEATQVYNQITSVQSPILNSTTSDSVTFVDTLPDANVIGNNIIYTTGGVLGDFNAPAMNLTTIFDTRVVGVVAEDPNTLIVSKNTVEGAPVEFVPQFTIYVAPNVGTTASTGPITSLAPMDDKLILFKENAINYINGTGPNTLGTTAQGSPLGQYSQPTFIASSVGCTNQNSLVLIPQGLMFQSDKGIWLLGRNLETSYIGAPVEAYNSYTVTSANIIPETNYVLFTLNTNIMLMYDYYYNQWGTFVGVSAVNSCIYQGLHTIIDQYGRILQETPGQYLDVATPVLASFKTGWLKLAGLQGYQRFYEFELLAKYLSPNSLLCMVAYDYNSSPLNSKLITPSNYSSPIPGPFGTPTPFGGPNNKEEWRIHAKKQLCESFQLTVQEVFNPAYGTTAGAGFTMSGISLVVGVKKGIKPFTAATTAGMS